MDKYCKDCKWQEENKVDVLCLSLWLCAHPDTVKVNRVTGEKIKSFCDNQRIYDCLACGPEGRLWEPN